MPARIEPPTVNPAYGAPSISIVPRSGVITPPRIFIRVDLPAPFSPTRPMTSPDRTSMLKSESARTPGYDLLIPVSLRNGSAELDAAAVAATEVTGIRLAANARPARPVARSELWILEPGELRLEVGLELGDVLGRHLDARDDD